MTTQEYVESLTDEECDRIVADFGPTVLVTDEQFDLLVAIYKRRWTEHLLTLLSA